MNAITLYGTPLSLYTGRARSYFIKAGLAYREVTPNNPHYLNVVVPKAGGRQGMPTIETPEGNVIRDGAAIIEHFKAIAGHPFSPSTPKQRILSLLFDVIGAEGLLRPAMHYRWNFPTESGEHAPELRHAGFARNSAVERHWPREQPRNLALSA